MEIKILQETRHLKLVERNIKLPSLLKPLTMEDYTRWYFNNSSDKFKKHLLNITSPLNPIPEMHYSLYKVKPEPHYERFIMKDEEIISELSIIENNKILSKQQILWSMIATMCKRKDEKFSGQRIKQIWSERNIMGYFMGDDGILHSADYQFTGGHFLYDVDYVDGGSHNAGVNVFLIH
ncbi:MAG: hypothetical protein WC603_02565 [Candidatus Paceibacterota bacterium]|jgi:hypothetical protein